MQNLIAILIMAVMLAGCTGPGSNPPPSSGTPSGGNSELNACLADCKDTNSNVGNGCKQVCYSNAAKATMDAGYCDAMLPYVAENLTNLYDGCFWDVAKGKKDASLCDKIKVSSNRDNCLLDVAKDSKNPAICNGIKDSNTKNACVSNAS